MSRHILASFLLAQLSMIPPALAECRQTDGLEELLQPGTTVLFGEIHGTDQAPEFVANAACLATAAGHRVTIGLEVPFDEDERFQAFLSSEGGLSDREALLAGPFWAGDYQDGRRSRAMLALLDRARRLKRAGHAVAVRFFDGPGTPGQTRDQAMGHRLRQAMDEAPEDVFLVLAGNVHSSVTMGTPWDESYEPMGHVMVDGLEGRRVVALNLSSSGGRAWVCFGGPETCGAKKMGGRGARHAWKVTVDGETPGERGHHGHYHVGDLTASMPAVDQAEHYWPGWRGPAHNGVAPHGDPPLTWSEEENIRLKVEIPGRGLASPIVWGDKVFILTAVPVDAVAYEASQQAAAKKLENRQWPPSVEPVQQRFLVIALSRDDGSVIWQRTAVTRVPHESHYIDSSWASASPVTDGHRLFAHFGSNGLFAYDLDGQLLWDKDLGDMTTRNGFGEGGTPALHGNTLVVNWDHEGDSFIVALDARTGRELWRSERPGEVTSWATPLVVESGGRVQVVVPATGKSRGYDLETGEEIWSSTGMTVNTIPSPVYRDGMVYLTSGYRGNLMQAVDLAKAEGLVNDTAAVAWTHDRHTPYVPSPILYGDRICFVKHFKNIFTCLDAATGEVLYTEERLEGISNVYASPVGAAGRLYLFGRDGKGVVLDAGREYKVLATSSLDDGVDASPAIAGDEIYLRGQRYLYVISARGADEEGKTEGTSP